MGVSNLDHLLKRFGKAKAIPQTAYKYGPNMTCYARVHGYKKQPGQIAMSEDIENVILINRGSSTKYFLRMFITNVSLDLFYWEACGISVPNFHQ